MAGDLALAPAAGHEPAASDARPTIVFLHGTRLTGAMWAAQVEALAEGFHCLAPDLPGHGTAADVPFSLDDAARRVASLIEREAHDGRAIVVGLSLGGYVAMAVAAGWPERVRGLVVAGATAEPVGLRALAYRGLATAFIRVPERALERVNRWYFRRRFPAAIADPILDAGFSFAGGAVALRALVGRRFGPLLAAYEGPTLSIVGEYDLFFRPAERSFLAGTLRPRRMMIRRATHLANLDQPVQFSAAIRAFALQVG